MDTTDPRTRSQVTLDSSRVLPASLQSKSLQRTLLANASSAVALYAGREWLLRLDVGVFWVLMRVLACGGIGALVWAAWTGKPRIARRKSWSVLGVSSLALLLQQACLLVALLRLSPLRVIILTHAYTLWPHSLLANRPARRLFATGLAISLAFLSDSQFSSENFRQMALAYGALTLHALSTLSYEHAQSVLSPSLGTDLALAGSTLGAAILGLPLYGFRRALIERLPPPYLPLSSLAAIPLLAYSLLVMSSSMTHAARSTALPSTLFKTSYPSTLLFTSLTGILAFSQHPTLSDIGVALLLSYGLHTTSSLAQAPSRTAGVRLLRAYMKTILSNPESRKIFYFLMLNMAYMLVQVVYGVWTNSLGLISDAIHMAFDCMAIGVGLFASVMATWDPNEQYTYGYGRIETLSGFANGVFLILISVFIVFEAVQRILDPPEMETSQLLLVSSLGLAVNLFGMFAMGGHHHHGGHSHSHGHSHGGGGEESHGHSHASTSPAAHSGHSHALENADTHGHSHSSEKVDPFGHAHHDDGCEKDHHSHSHSHDHAEELTAAHSHAHKDGTNGHDESHGHGHSHSHSHEEHDEHGHQHSHSHNDEHCDSHSPDDHDHNHSHAHGEDDHHPHEHEAPDHSHSHSHGHHDASWNDRHPQESTHSHSEQSDPGASAALGAHTGVNHKRPAQKRQFSGPSLRIPDAHDVAHSRLARESDLGKPSPLAKTLLQHQREHSAVMPSPITPNYSFTHDEHYESHHAAEQGPNLRSKSNAHAHEGHSDNMRGVFLHVMADTLGSVGVIISTLLIQYYGWTGFDPIASLFIAILIVASVVPLVIDTGKILCLDASNRDADVQNALAELSSIPGLASYTSPRFWPKDSSTLIGSIHIQLEPSAASFDPTGPHSAVRASYANVDRVVERVDTVLKAQIKGLEELTIQVEGI